MIPQELLKLVAFFCMFGSDLNRSDMALPKMNILAETLGMMMFMKNWHQQVNYCKILQTQKKKTRSHRPPLSK